MKKTFFSLALYSAAILTALAQAPSPSPSPSGTPDPTLPKGIRFFNTGHSFASWHNRHVADMAKAAGIQGHTSAAMGLGGARVLDIWNIPDVPNKKKPDKNYAREALAAGTVDVLALAPIWMPDEGIDKFVELGLAHNPNLRIVLQEFWMPNDVYEPIYPLDRHKLDSVEHHNKTDLAALQKAQDAYDRDVEAYCAAINKRVGRNLIEIIPVGNAVIALRKKIVAGEAPGLTKQSELFTDPWGHVTDVTHVLASYCYYAVIYKRSPVGLPMPTQPDGKLPNPELNKLLQEIAWDAVIKCPMSGVKG